MGMDRNYRGLSFSASGVDDFQSSCLAENRFRRSGPRGCGGPLVYVGARRNRRRDVLWIDKTARLVTRSAARHFVDSGGLGDIDFAAFDQQKHVFALRELVLDSSLLGPRVFYCREPDGSFGAELVASGETTFASFALFYARDLFVFNLPESRIDDYAIVAMD